MTDTGYTKMQELLDEFTSDVSLSQMNLEDKTLEAPAYPAKWIGIHHTYRHELQVLNGRLGVAQEKEDRLLRGKLKIGASDAQIKQLKLKNHNEMKDLLEKIGDHKELIEMLSKLEKTVGFYRNDIRNAVEYAKMLNQ